MTPMVWRSAEDESADDWTIESPGQAVYGTLSDIAARLPGGDYYLAERDGDEEPWVIVTADGANEVAQCPTEEEAVALISALRQGAARGGGVSMGKIDYALLAWQRGKIIEIIGDFAEWQEDGSRQDQIDALEGVLNLLDAMTDEAIANGEATEEEALIKTEPVVH